MWYSQRLIRNFYFSYTAYGIYVILLCLEASLYLFTDSLSLAILVEIGLLTILYYAASYLYTPANRSDERSQWWKSYKSKIIIFYLSLLLIALYILISGLIVFPKNNKLFLISFFTAAILAVLYYGWPNSNYNIRRFLFLKPFLIGGMWSYMTILLPAFLIESIVETTPIIVWFIQQLLFIALLAIIFDIKDSSIDAADGLDTYVLKLGLNRLKTAILYPLLIVSCIAAMFNYFPYFKDQLNLLPICIVPQIGTFLLLKRIHEQKPVLYYLAWVDGLLLLKAVSGIMLFYCKN